MYEYKPTTVDYGFDPSIDLKPVDPYGFVDLREAYVSGSVPGIVSVDDTRFNGVADPSVMMERPKDNFERMRQAEYVKSVLQTAAKAEAEAGHSETA